MATNGRVVSASPPAMVRSATGIGAALHMSDIEKAERQVPVAEMINTAIASLSTEEFRFRGVSREWQADNNIGLS